MRSNLSETSHTIAFLIYKSHYSLFFRLNSLPLDAEEFLREIQREEAAKAAQLKQEIAEERLRLAKEEEEAKKKKSTKKKKKKSKKSKKTEL